MHCSQDAASKNITMKHEQDKHKNKSGKNHDESSLNDEAMDKPKAENIQQFVCEMLKRVQEMKNSLKPSMDSVPHLDFPNAIGPETDSVIDEMRNDEPIARVRKFIILPGKDRESGMGKIEDMLRKLMAARDKDIDGGMREVFASVRHAKTSGSPVYQMHALRQIDSLLREVDAEIANELRTVKSSVLAGTENDLDAASFRLRNVFASRMGSPNVRLAYTSLSTQFGEGYQLCPKAAHQIGRALPMEISKCRDNCIDSRVTRDGAVTCAYADWLRKAADNYKASEDRIERVKHDLNDKTLNETNAPDPVKSYEGQLNETRDKYTQIDEKCMESNLDSMEKAQFGHQGETLKRIQDLLTDKRNNSETREEALDESRTDEDYDNTSLEQMLEDEREPLNEQELDMLLEELLASARTED